MQFWNPLILGFAQAVVVGHLLTWWVVRSLWRQVAGPCDLAVVRPHAHFPILVGILERGLFVAVLLAGQAEFIGVWLAIKVAAQWSYWAEGFSQGEVRITGRALFNIFLIGNALSLMFAASGWKLVEWLRTGRFVDGAILSLASIGVAVFIWLVGRVTAPRPQNGNK